MIPTPDNIASSVSFLLGDPDTIEDRPDRPFSPLRIAFLADLSKALMADARCREYPDIIAFAFWCRRANLERVAQRSSDTQLRVGLGLVFHIAPSNVPVNFAYSLVFAFLAGNSNVVRLASTPTPQAALLVEFLGQLLSDDVYQSLRHTIHLIRYEKADHVSEFWLQKALGRIVWGGDATVAYLRSLKSHPRCREIAFADRYSLCALHAQSIVDAEHTKLEALCANLYNDVYLMDQRACSSPQLLVWVGAPQVIIEAQARLWPLFANYAKSKYPMEAVQVMDKYVDVCRNVIDYPNISSVAREHPVLARIELDALGDTQCQQRGYFGTIHEFATDTLDALAPIVDARFQTLTYFGFDHATLREFILSNRLTGIDRIVPVGKALEMGFYWDGFDIIASLSRLVDIQ